MYINIQQVTQTVKNIMIPLSYLPTPVVGVVMAY